MMPKIALQTGGQTSKKESTTKDVDSELFGMNIEEYEEQLRKNVALFNNAPYDKPPVIKTEDANPIELEPFYYPTL